MRGLSVLVQEELELDPFSQHLFAFCNRRKLRFLLSEVFNHVLLVSIDPAREDQHQKLQWQSVH